MILTAKIVRLIQKSLNFPESDIDGIMGNQTETALEGFLRSNSAKIDQNHFQSILSGGRKRKATAYGQIMAHKNGFDSGKVDGFLGPQTDFALMQLISFVETGKKPFNWRDREPTPNPHNWPKESRDQQAIIDTYGNPGSSRLKKISLPYEHRLSWDLSTKVNKTSCHELVAESLESVLVKVRDHYQISGIKELGLDLFGGCYNKRRKRGGTTWSMHSWGIAVDYHPTGNQLRWGWDRAVFARPEYNKWWEFWEEEGWIGLGRVANYDWMHIQAARRA